MENITLGQFLDPEGNVVGLTQSALEAGSGGPASRGPGRPGEACAYWSSGRRGGISSETGGASWPGSGSASCSQTWFSETCR